MSINIKYQDIPWIENIPVEKQYNELLKIIKLGKSIIEFTQITINPECSVFDPLCKKFDLLEKDTKHNRQVEYEKMENSRVMITNELAQATKKVDRIYELIQSDQNEHQSNLSNIKESIEIFTKSTNKSSVKGKISESIVENIISHFFTNDTIIDTSKKSRAGDYQLIGNDGNTLLIEIKNYKTPVDQNEIDKFRRDIQHNKMHGIFISTTSKIVKKKNLEIEELSSGEITVYISNTGISGESIILGILLLKELIARKSQQKLSISSINTSEIYENLDKFSDICKLICNMSSTINNIKENINKNLQDLYNEAYKCQLEVKSVFKKIKYEITNELNKVHTDIMVLELDKRDIILEQIKIDTPKLISFIELLFDIEDSTKCGLSLESTKWYILNRNLDIICDIKRYKSKIELKFVHKNTYCIQVELNINNRPLIESEILKAV